MNQIRETDKKYIKYNSLPKDGIGKEIRKLTKEIKRELFKNENIKLAKDNIYKSIDKINDILIDVDKRNNISDIGFETAIENKLIQEKIDKSDTYILNAIANHALYNFDYYKSKIKKSDFKIEDVINQVAYENYKENYDSIKKRKIKVYKIKLLKNYFTGHTYKSKTLRALERLGYEQDQVAKKFYEMFEENEKNEYNNTV